MKKKLLLALLSSSILLFGCPSDKEEPGPSSDREALVKSFYIHFTDFPESIDCNEIFEIRSIKMKVRVPTDQEGKDFGFTASNVLCKNILKTKPYAYFRIGPGNYRNVFELDISHYKGIKRMNIYVTYTNAYGGVPEIGLYDFSDKLIRREKVPNATLDGRSSVEMSGDFDNIKKIVILNQAEVTDFNQLTLYSI